MRSSPSALVALALALTLPALAGDLTQDRTGDLPADWKAKLQPEGDAWKGVEQVFKFNNGTEPETLDLHIMTGVTENRLATALFEGLVSQHPETLDIVPGVAKSWTISADRTVYTFHLRDDAKWTTGDPVTAQDFYDSWERALTPETTCQYGYMFFPIKNSERFYKGELKDFKEVGVRVQDAHTLVVTLTNPCPYFLHLAAFKTLYPVPMAVVKKHGDQWTRPENIVSNGPFRLTEWIANQRIEMVPNEHYWDRKQVKLTKLIAYAYTDPETSYKLFQQEQMDWCTTIPTPKVDEIKRMADYYAQPYLGSYFYRFNVEKAPFDDVRVRRALCMGFDREVITRDLLKGGQIPAGYFCPKMLGYEAPPGLRYDRDAARKLLADAGFPGGKGFPTIDLLYNTQDSHKQVAEAIARQWKENLGITVSLRNNEWKVYLAEVDKRNFNLARGGWIGDYVDPNTFLDLFMTGGGNNNTGWGNAKYDELIRGAAATGDQKERFKLFYQAEKILVEDEVPIIPIYIYVNQGLLAEKVAGWYENVLDHHTYQYIWIESLE